jgi:hypothetical protein
MNSLLKKHFNGVTEGEDRSKCEQPFKVLLQTQTLETDCEPTLREWNTILGSSAKLQRTSWRYALENFQPTCDEYKIAAKKRDKLLQCAGHLTGISLLFRGIRDEDRAVEDLCSTSLSWAAASAYGFPMMIIYVPDSTVLQGLVVEKQKQREDVFEILLTTPKMQQIAAEHLGEVFKNMSSFTGYTDLDAETLQVWTCL